MKKREEKTRGNYNATETERQERISYHINVSAAEHTAHSGEAVDEFVIYLPDIISFWICSCLHCVHYGQTGYESIAIGYLIPFYSDRERKTLWSGEG